MNPEQSRARHSDHVALHRRRGTDRAREHDLERAISATERKRAFAHARRVARADQEDSLRRIFFSRRCSPARPEFCSRVLSSWALATFVFKLSYTPSFAPLLVAALAVPLLTIAIGLAASRGVGNAPPLAILRAELD